MSKQKHKCCYNNEAREQEKKCLVPGKSDVSQHGPVFVGPVSKQEKNSTTSQPFIRSWKYFKLVCTFSHISQSRTSSLVKEVAEVVGGSHLCSALLHTLICPCHERVLQFLLFSGVLGSNFDRFHLWSKATKTSCFNREQDRKKANILTLDRCNNYAGLAG